MTSLGSSLSSDTSRAGSAWTSRYSTGVRTSSNSTGLPRSRMASSSLGVIVATLTESSLRLLKLGTTSDPHQGLKQAKPSFSRLRLDFSRIVWISLRRSPCYNIQGFVDNQCHSAAKLVDVVWPSLPPCHPGNLTGTHEGIRSE